jgi:SAM-dependent methyltransferase
MDLCYREKMTGRQQLDPEDLLNSMAEQFPDCLDYWREFNRYKFNLEQLLPLVGPDSNVLDIGAGHGVMSVGLRATGAEVTAVDSWIPYTRDESGNDPAMHRTGNRENILKRFRDHGIHAIETDILADKLPLEDGSIDVAIILAVIEHFPGSPKRILEEAKRVLKPAGVLVIEVPNAAALRNRLKLLLGRSIHFAIEDWYYSDPFHGHFRELTMAELKKHVEFLGMETIWTRTSDSSFHNTKYSDGSYERKYRFNSAFQIAKAFYLLACRPFPTLQFQLMVAARKV